MGTELPLSSDKAPKRAASPSELFRHHLGLSLRSLSEVGVHSVLQGSGLRGERAFSRLWHGTAQWVGRDAAWHPAKGCERK